MSARKPRPEDLLAAIERAGVAHMLTAACEAHQVDPLLVMGRDNFAELAAARRAFWRSLHAAGWAYARIGRLVGRDHATVMAGISGKRREKLRGQRRLSQSPTACTIREAYLAILRCKETATRNGHGARALGLLDALEAIERAGKKHGVVLGRMA